MALALENKIQILFLVAALPVLLLPFGPERSGCTFWRSGPASLACLAAAAAAAAVTTWAASGTIIAGLSTLSTPTLHLPQLAVGAPLYWPLLAAWLAAGMAVYAVVWKVPPLEALTIGLAIVTSLAIGVLALDLRFALNDAVVVFHPIEQMYAFGESTAPQLATGGFTDRLLYFVDAFGGLIARRTFVLQSSPRPTIFLEWFVIAATIYALRRRQWPTVLQVAALMATVYGVDALGMARGLKQEYFLLSDPLVIIAAAILLVRLPALQTHRLAYPAGVALIVAHVAISQAEPVKHIFRTDGPEVLCGLYHSAVRVEHLPVCATLPKR